jgi:glycerophosphoryl diester phosphodiesterase
VRAGRFTEVTRTAYTDHPGPIPLAHRGFSLDGLENSMAAFAAAVDLGFRYVETDVHATSDGVVVAFHDERLDRVTDGSGAIAQLTWDAVSGARIRGSEAIPRLADLLGTWPDLRVNIDIKAAGAIAPLVEVVERTGAHDRVCVTSFSDRRRRAALRRFSRPVATSGGRATVALFLAALLVPSLWRAAAVRTALSGVDLLQVPERSGIIPVVTAGSVQAAQSAGVPVHVWTVDEPAEMHRLLDLGVQGIVTDRADLLRAVLLERGTWA